MLTLEAFKSQAAWVIRNALSSNVKEDEALFGESVRDFISDGSVDKAESFSVKLTRARVSAFVTELQKHYTVVIISRKCENSADNYDTYQLRLTSKSDRNNTVDVYVYERANSKAGKCPVKSFDLDVNTLYIQHPSLVGIKTYHPSASFEDIRKNIRAKQFVPLQGCIRAQAIKLIKNRGFVNGAKTGVWYGSSVISESNTWIPKEDPSIKSEAPSQAKLESGTAKVEEPKMNESKFKNGVGNCIIKNISASLQDKAFDTETNKAYEAIFGGAVRDFVKDGNFDNVNDFDVVVSSSARMLELVAKLREKYFVKEVMGFYYHKLPHGIKKTTLLISSKESTHSIKIDLLYNKQGVLQEPIIRETLDADVNAFYMNPLAFEGVRNYITNSNEQLEDVKKRAKNASYKTFPGMDKRRRAKFDARYWHCAGEFQQSLVDLINEKIKMGAAPEDFSGYPVSAPVQEKKEKGFFMNIDKEKVARILKNGTIRSAGKLSVEAARQGTLFMLKQSGMEESMATKFLETPFGTTLVNGIFFGLLTFGPGISDNPKAAIMAEEYGTEGVSSAQVNIIMPMMAIVGPMIKQALDSIPDSVLDNASSAPSAPPVRVAENKASDKKVASNEVEEEVNEFLSHVGERKQASV
jgi:hypothetical protein